MNSSLISRPSSMSWLDRWRDRDVIKVITGMRRSGKSTALELFRRHLLSDGVPVDHMVSVDLERLGFDAPTTAEGLYRYVDERLAVDGTTYVFLDEVQRVRGFELAVDALYARDGVDLYVTGSNSSLLSSEIATLLAGRHVEHRMLPLSFSEYRPCFSSVSPEMAFNRFLTFGGMPYTVRLPEQDIGEYLDGVFSSALVRDVSRRHPRFDAGILERLVAFMADNVGNRFSLATIAAGLAKRGDSISPTTVGEYLAALRDAYLIFEARGYEVRGRRLLKRGGKYYLGDLGIRHLLVGHDQRDLGHRIENVVYLELLRRYEKVFVGSLGDAEVDFVCEGASGRAYYQVALSVLDEGTLARELAPLRRLRDNYPKSLLTLDRVGVGDMNGIAHENLVDWLLADA